jgi:hypothetical protein
MYSRINFRVTAKVSDDVIDIENEDVPGVDLDVNLRKVKAVIEN